MFGIPKLLKNAPKAVGISLLGRAASSLFGLFSTTVNWGIYKRGTSQPAFEVTSVVELDVAGESQVSDYPIENGTFTTYNKVVQPNLFSLRITRDGSTDKRSAFLTWLKNNAGNFELYDVLCPEGAYKNVTLKSYRVTRNSSSGAAMIVADCLFQEVRQIPAAYTNTSVPKPENKPTVPTVKTFPISIPNITGVSLPKLPSIPSFPNLPSIPKIPGIS